jgi:uncharacterized protein
MKSAQSNDLCLECGLCCNGVIFARGQLQREDNVERLHALGLQLAPGTRVRRAESSPKRAIGNRQFLQPCAAFDGCQCRIYQDRPAYCRQFECLLLKSLHEGRTEGAVALRIVRTARRRVDKVKGLLRELGDADEQTALSIRFRRMKKRFEANGPDQQSAELFGQLTLAVHNLNILLSESFYPGAD